MRCLAFYLFAAMVTGLVLGGAGHAAGQTADRPSFDPMLADAMRADARLHDVCFVSPTVGWAVGDRGTIWHTDDGGRQWQLQDSGVGCPLYSVWFLDEQVGWAAGGASRPYRHNSTGVLLRTADGGRTWKATSKFALQTIHKIRFFDRRAGYALGDASALFPSGVFVTQSGGLDWRPLQGNSAGGWRGGDLIDPSTGALAGPSGAVAAVRRGTIDADRSPPFGLRTLRAAQLVRPTWGWLVGDGALVMLTGDLGVTWRPTPGELPPGVFENFDFAALAVRGPKCWVAGSPGTRVLRTDDAGRHWTASATGQNAPISAIAMVDDQHGWAVGALGTILATDDGGQSWRRQRSGGVRAALLGLFSRPEDVPLELFAQASGNDGYLGVVEVLNRDDPRTTPSRRAAPPEDRLREAIVRVGGSDAAVAWQFPARSSKEELSSRAIIEDWNRANDGRGLEMLQTHLVRRIRLWRPEVVVTHDVDPTGVDPLRQQINQAVIEAVARAADPTAHVDQLAVGLAPWQVKKVYGLQPDGGGSSATRLNEAQVAPRLARSLGEAAADARGLLEEDYSPGPESLGFRLIVAGTNGETAGNDLFAQIALTPGGETRRNLMDAPPGGLAAIEALARRRRTIRAILRQSTSNASAASRLLVQAGELTRDLDDTSAGRILYHLAGQYRRQGQWPLAAETMEALADRYPDHPLAGEALAWLVQYHAGAEAAWRVQGQQRTTTQALGRPATSTLSIDPSAEENRPAKAAEFARRIERTRPELFLDPAIRFPLSVADRRQGRPGEAEQYLMLQRRRADHDAWWSCAQGEAWLATRTGHSPKPVVRCRLSAVKPTLDGRLDEPCWKQAEEAVLVGRQPGDPARPAVLKLARDDQFLYLACRCEQEPGVNYANPAGPRPRDADLSGRDRVELFLDVDRDYASYYRLAFDHAGRTRDECWGDPSWNPTWFVAAASDAKTWTVEAAIPLEGLTGRFPRAGDVWALGVQRIVSGAGFQSWNTPAAPAVLPEGFGYLVFE